MFLALFLFFVWLPFLAVKKHFLALLWTYVPSIGHSKRRDFCSAFFPILMRKKIHKVLFIQRHFLLFNYGLFGIDAFKYNLNKIGNNPRVWETRSAADCGQRAINRRENIEHKWTVSKFLASKITLLKCLSSNIFVSFWILCWRLFFVLNGCSSYELLRNRNNR